MLVLIRCDELGPPTRQPVLTDARRADTCREGYSNRTSMHYPTQIVQYRTASSSRHTYKRPQQRAFEKLTSKLDEEANLSMAIVITSVHSTDISDTMSVLWLGRAEEASKRGLGRQFYCRLRVKR